MGFSVCFFWGSSLVFEGKDIKERVQKSVYILDLRASYHYSPVTEYLEYFPATSKENAVGTGDIHLFLGKKGKYLQVHA